MLASYSSGGNSYCTLCLFIQLQLLATQHPSCSLLLIQIRVSGFEGGWSPSQPLQGNRLDTPWPDYQSTAQRHTTTHATFTCVQFRITSGLNAHAFGLFEVAGVPGVKSAILYKPPVEKGPGRLLYCEVTSCTNLSIYSPIINTFNPSTCLFQNFPNKMSTGMWKCFI